MGKAPAYMLSDQGFMASTVVCLFLSKWTITAPTESSHQDHSHTSSGPVKTLKAFWVCQSGEENPPGSLTPTRYCLISHLSYIPGTREISLRVAETHISWNWKPVLPSGKGRLYNLLVFYPCTSLCNCKWAFPVCMVPFHAAYIPPFYPRCSS